MATFRTNHNRQGKAGTNMIRIGLLAVLLSGLFFLFSLFLKDRIFPGSDDRSGWSGSDTFYLPGSGSGQVIHHTFYSLSYDETHEQAEWVAYILQKERLDLPWVERPDKYLEDPKVEHGSARWYDYRGSGYDRGHLVPAADMAFSEKAVRETFYMSNISPQARPFNGGIWRELEELTREWARKEGKLYVVTGPVLSAEPKGVLGKENRISIPAAFYKVLLDLGEPEVKGIAFVLPNEISYEPLSKYAVTIDEAEQLTGLDFFPELMTDKLEAELESQYDLSQWKFSPQKYEIRKKYWNKER